MTRPCSARGRRRLRAYRAAGVPLCRRCHARPGAVRYYAPHPLRTALAGAQVKFSMKETRGCRPCWDLFVYVTAEHLAGVLSPAIRRYQA